MRVVTIIINERCPLRCRHCSLGFSLSNRGNSYRVNSDDLVRMVENVAPGIYEMVLFAGGEPSLDPALVKIGVETCRRMGLVSAMVSAPVWAATETSASWLLDKIGDLSHLILSYDSYHLDFLKLRHYENAARQAASRGILVDLHLTYATEAEKQDLIESVASIRPLVFIHPQRTVSIGNAADPANVQMNRVTVNNTEDLAAMPRSCMLGNVLVDSKFGIHGCCWSSSGEASPFSFAGDRNSLAETFQSLEENPLMQRVMKKGFLNALSKRGKEMLVDRLRGQRFGNECDICVAAMQKGAEEIWHECLGPDGSSCPTPAIHGLSRAGEFGDGLVKRLE
jgi:organic radical activating enzyme